MRKLLLIAIMATLSACQQTVDTNIASSGTGLNSAGAIGMDETASALDADLVRKVTEKLAQLGYHTGETPAYHLDIAASQGPVAAKVIEATAKTGSKAARPKPRPWFRKCTPTLYRFSVVLTDVRDGSLIYRGDASEEHCQAGDRMVFPYLADAALEDLKSPRSARVQKRAIGR